MNYKAWNLWHLGFPDQARITAEQALSWAREIKHPNTIGIALCYGVALTNIWLRDADRVESAATESLQRSSEMSLGLWKAWGPIHLGWALAERAGSDALVELEAGLEEARRIGANRLEAFHLGLLADVRSRAGQHGAAKAALAAAFVTLTTGRDMPFASDLYRLRAAATLRDPAGAMDEAVGDLHQALSIARDQGARSLELRAARDLARLWAEHGERQRASDLLAPVYGWFTEGFSTPDLEDARMLLERL
jgi:predicted ATPase